ncbi:hypothetical protein NUSPORA_00830 [Nucleospora cyclopteri]
MVVYNEDRNQPRDRNYYRNNDKPYKNNSTDYNSYGKDKRRYNEDKYTDRSYTNDSYGKDKRRYNEKQSDFNYRDYDETDRNYSYKKYDNSYYGRNRGYSKYKDNNYNREGGNNTFYNKDSRETNYYDKKEAYYDKYENSRYSEKYDKFDRKFNRNEIVHDSKRYKNNIKEEEFNGNDFRDKRGFKQKQFHIPLPVKKKAPSKTVKLLRISTYATEEDIKEKLEEKKLNVQEITIKIPIDERTGLSKGIAYLRFNSLEESMNAEKALEDESIKGQMIFTDYA